MITIEIVSIIAEYLILVFCNQNYIESHNYNDKTLCDIKKKYPNHLITLDERL